jgi:hypothetical protein
MAVAEFLALYRGRTVSEAELVAICAEPQIVRMFIEELAARPTEEDDHRNPRSRVAELKRGEHKE